MSKIVCDKVVCVKDGLQKMVCDKVKCERGCVKDGVSEIEMAHERWNVKDGG